MQRRSFVIVGAAFGLQSGWPAAAAPAPRVHVYKNPDCGCCADWVRHLEHAGFVVDVTATDDTIGMRQRLGMPDRLGSCHTATVNGYVLEGHVPAAEIRRLLAAKPRALGLAVPSMPVGAPGMEVGDRRDPFDVFLVDRSGGATVFAHYPKPA